MPKLLKIKSLSMYVCLFGNCCEGIQIVNRAVFIYLQLWRFECKIYHTYI